jgi:hypothetical protein
MPKDHSQGLAASKVAANAIRPSDPHKPKLMHRREVDRKLASRDPPWRRQGPCPRGLVPPIAGHDLNLEPALRQDRGCSVTMTHDG